jgi:hypothetical protein
MKVKQTAVEWLFDQLPEHLRLSENGFDMLQQAKEIEKEQTNVGVGMLYSRAEYWECKANDLFDFNLQTGFFTLKPKK